MTNAAAPTSEPAGDPAAWVDEHGDHLLRFALVRVRLRSVAEDLVQETFLAALKARANFRGGSSVRTWLTGILKFKIIDHFRVRHRETPFSQFDFGGDDGEAGFDETRHWKASAAPQEWEPDRASSSDRAGFLRAYLECSGKLPPQMARVFTLRELDGMPTEEVCKIAGLTPTNLFTIMHRARLALRRCLEESWFTRHDARN